MNRHEEFCTYNQAVRLKVIGFDWECYEFWSKDFCTDGAPTKIRRTKTEPKVCVMSERNSMLDKMDADLITAPTQSVATRWLREVHKLNIRVNYFSDYREWFFDILNLEDDFYYDGGLDEYFATYEAALSAGIDAVLELIEVKQYDTRKTERDLGNAANRL